MVKKTVFIVAVICIAISLLQAISLSAEILGPEVRVRNNDIIVNTELASLGEIETAIKSGIEKGIVFTIELFRAWRFWPDEFVLSKKIKRIIRYDNLRGQYLALAYTGTSQIKKKFKDFNSMKAWVFAVNDLNLANIQELEPGSYYIRVVAESKSRELPPLIGFLMLFIPEVEMSLAKESHSFIVGDNR